MSQELPVLPSAMVKGEPDEAWDYLSMPRNMHTFEIPPLPEAEVIARYPQALQALDLLLQALQAYRFGLGHQVALDALPEPAVALLYQVLGEGEVSIRIQGAPPLCIQETILAGVWWLQELTADGSLQRQWLEVADIPAVVQSRAFALANWPLLPTECPPGVENAASVLVELLAAAKLREGAERDAHVVNLSLLPLSPSDYLWLDQQLGCGPVVLLSRGYGNCRISSTTIPLVWRVQYYNSTDQLILDTLEVTAMPQVACAAKEDLEDSGERLQEMRGVLV